MKQWLPSVDLQVFSTEAGQVCGRTAEGHHPCPDTSLFKEALVELLGLGIEPLEIISSFSGENQGPRSGDVCMTGVSSACSPHTGSLHTPKLELTEKICVPQRDRGQRKSSVCSRQNLG